MEDELPTRYNDEAFPHSTRDVFLLFDLFLTLAITNFMTTMCFRKLIEED